MSKPWLLGGALLLSLAANLFMAGWLLGRPAAPLAAAQMAHPERPGPALQRLMQRVETLPPAQRREVRQLMRQYAPQLRALGEQNRQSRETLQQLISQADLPRAELEAAFARQRQLQEQMQSLMQQMLLDIAEQLPAEQRARLLQREGHRT